MPSLAILAVSFLATLTLAASFGGRRSDEYPSLCSSGKYLPLSPDGEHPITSNMTFSLLAVFKDNTKVSQPLVLRSTQPGVDGGVGGWLAVCTLLFFRSLRPQSEINGTVLMSYIWNADFRCHQRRWQALPYADQRDYGIRFQQDPGCCLDSRGEKQQRATILSARVWCCGCSIVLLLYRRRNFGKFQTRWSSCEKFNQFCTLIR